MHQTKPPSTLRHKTIYIRHLRCKTLRGETSDPSSSIGAGAVIPCYGHLSLWDSELVWEATFTLKKIGSRYRDTVTLRKNAQLMPSKPPNKNSPTKQPF